MSSTPFDGLSFVGFRRLFYAVLPGESSYPSLEAVPNYVDQAIVWFIAFVIVEFLVTKFDDEKSHWYAINDSITSIGAGLLQSTLKTVCRSAEIWMYIWVYDHYRLADIPWDSNWTWFLGFLSVDFAYYCFHRASHEYLLFWGFHQMHHSSEYYNFGTALRQGIVQGYFSMFFYIPASLILPPQVHLAHAYLNLLYQFWIHTQLIDKLGPLEYVFNTPSHHRVHHGRNPYCIDKNYGGTLIIWDRMFGTFAEERTGEDRPVYGLVHNVRSFNPLWCQTFLFKYALWTRPKSVGKTSWWDAVQVPFRGPGWEPGVLKTSSEDGIPPIKHPVKPYNPLVPLWLNVYICIHFFIPLFAYLNMAKMDRASASTLELTLYAAFIIGSLQSFGMLLDNRSLSWSIELFRCLLVSAFQMLGNPVTDSLYSDHLLALKAMFWGSSMLWLLEFLVLLPHEAAVRSRSPSMQQDDKQK